MAQSLYDVGTGMSNAYGQSVDPNIQTQYGPKYIPSLAGGGNSGGQVLGASTSAGAGDNFNAIANSVQGSNLLQTADKSSVPSDKDLQKVIQPGLDALNSYASTLSSQLPGTLAGLGEQKTASENSLYSSQAAQQGQLQQTQDVAGKQSEGSVNEARRAFDEVQTGLQARYGGTTGTGAFVGELAGRATLQNIAKIRDGYQTTIRQISDARTALDRDVADKLFQINTNYNDAVRQARNELDNRLADITSKKAELESRKAEMKLDAMKEYRNLKAQIDASNKAFMQDLYVKYQEKFGMLSQAKNVTDQNFLAELNAASGQSTSGINPNITEPKPTSAPSGLYYNPSSGGYNNSVKDQQNPNDPLNLLG